METHVADRDLTGADWVSDATDPQRAASTTEFVNTVDRSPNPSPLAPGTLAPPPKPQVNRGHHGNQGPGTAVSTRSGLETHHSRQTASTPIATTITRQTQPSLLDGCQTQRLPLDRICEGEYSGHTQAHQSRREQERKFTLQLAQLVGCWIFV